MRIRISQCKPGYSFSTVNGEIQVELVDGTTLNELDVAPHVIAPLKDYILKKQRLEKP